MSNFDFWQILCLATLFIGPSAFLWRTYVSQPRRRKKALRELADRLGLTYDHQHQLAVRFVGTYRDRSLTVVDSPNDEVTPSSIELSVSNPSNGHLELRPRSRIADRRGIQFDDADFTRAFLLRSQPASLAATALSSESLRARIRDCIRYSLSNPPSIKLDGNTLIYTRGVLEANAEYLHSLVELLNELADAVESQTWDIGH